MPTTTIIDIGTNTFEYLVAEFNADEYRILADGRIAVWLGKGGMTNGMIREDAFKRAESAFKTIAEKSKEHGSGQSVAVATSATRDASNGSRLLELGNQFGVEVSVINGVEEAQLIQKGAALSLPKGFPSHLVMDIGGGSLEFILVKNSTPVWQHSFQLGVTRIIENLKPQDPLTEIDFTHFKQLVVETLEPLQKAVEKNPVSLILGTAGSFDSLLEMLNARENIPHSKGLDPIPMHQFKRMNAELGVSTLNQRKSIPGLLSMRTGTIHLATALISEVIELLEIKELWRSPFSLREGVLKQLMDAVTNDY